MVPGSNMDQRHQHVFSHQHGLQTMDLNVVSPWAAQATDISMASARQGAEEQHESQSSVSHGDLIQKKNEPFFISGLRYLVVKCQGYRAVGQCVWSRTCMSSRLHIVLPSMLADMQVTQAQWQQVQQWQQQARPVGFPVELSPTQQRMLFACPGPTPTPVLLLPPGIPLCSAISLFFSNPLKPLSLVKF